MHGRKAVIRAKAWRTRSASTSCDFSRVGSRSEFGLFAPEYRSSRTCGIGRFVISGCRRQLPASVTRINLVNSFLTVLDDLLSSMRVGRISIKINIPEWSQHVIVLGLLGGAAVLVFLAYPGGH